MKKITFLFILIFVCISDSNALSKFYLGEKVPNMHVETISNEKVHNGVPFILRRDDGNFVYCLDQQQKINTTNYYNEYKINNELFGLTNSQMDKINLLAYLGYGYENHSDIKWYGITQFLIWKELNYKEIYFTDKAYGNRITAYSDEIAEMENLVNDYYKLPSFSNDYFYYTINQTYEVIDLNNVLNNYKIKDSNIDVKIIDNKLYINTEKEGKFFISFVKESPVKNDYILYELYGNQPLIYPGRINDIEFKIDIEVNSGSITINKFDSENIEREFAKLEGAIYGIYDEKELITTIDTNEKGFAYIDKLPLGKYFIKEITPSLGYKLDNNIYEVVLTTESRDIVVNSYEEVIKGNLIINKYYGNNDDYILEDDAEFEIYSINDKLIGIYKTTNGVINDKMEYGEYYGVQISGKPDYSFVDKFNILINEEKDYVFDLYDKKKPLIVEVPDTQKYDYNKFVSFSFVFIGLVLVMKYRKKTTDC